ncbi:hypothetical protein AYI69_g8829 [Smittium culicis]|uniref:Uncharacterized protein n=1 Tax=Smittium culicis TaxID=133412 RepID=A0A1R1XGW9_9FUNG|nr:hypothetical protein AYI69_g8829 [Smittium culicis]
MDQTNSNQSIQDRGKKLMPLLERRPSAKELEEKHVLLATNISPALHDAKHNLEKSKICDSLQSKLGKRPDRSTLVEKHIIEE